jgi:hypothetical protein
MSNRALMAAGWLTTAVVAVAVVVGLAAGGFGVGISAAEAQAAQTAPPAGPVQAVGNPDTGDTSTVIPTEEPGAQTPPTADAPAPAAEASVDVYDQAPADGGYVEYEHEAYEHDEVEHHEYEHEDDEHEEHEWEGTLARLFGGERHDD